MGSSACRPRFDTPATRSGMRHGRLARAADAGGVVRSAVFPGLQLNAGALLSDDLAAVVRTLHEGVADPSRAAFLSGLRTRRS